MNSLEFYTDVRADATAPDVPPSRGLASGYLADFPNVEYTDPRIVLDGAVMPVPQEAGRRVMQAVNVARRYINDGYRVDCGWFSALAAGGLKPDLAPIVRVSDDLELYEHGMRASKLLVPTQKWDTEWPDGVVAAFVRQGYDNRVSYIHYGMRLPVRGCKESWVLSKMGVVGNITLTSAADLAAWYKTSHMDVIRELKTWYDDTLVSDYVADVVTQGAA